jgi:hypothetical protein
MLFSRFPKLPIYDLNKRVNPYRSDGGYGLTRGISMTTKLEYEVVPISEVSKEEPANRPSRRRRESYSGYAFHHLV